ncbi:hypothetical protein GCM10007063_13360 [Lentibacillus kapialis]|uniref:Metallo-beta-lactamase domain-containing protein n=1 Tax=Lentibacillus kapialis TaxID=340214 RepID=A0A917UWJ8_9BACI|nr:MBL fold metallo-hydrolase [Lentibacillus kapialis]GGJ92078.1 hypothetical protein GCM10007063_13360 [Lentibacillus kapialis]
MELTIVGYWGGYPAPDGATSAYMLEQDDFTLLIDVGSGSLSKLQKTKHVMDLDAVILSHYHHDHIGDIGVLQHAWLIQSYIHQSNEILPIYAHAEDEEGFKSLTHKNTEGIAYDPSQTLEVGPFSITFLKTDHPVACFGMRITNGDTTLVYTADTAFKEEWYEFAQDADFLITDCNFYEDQDGASAGHMTSKEGALIAQKANVGKLILSHLPQYRDNNDLVKEAKQYFNGSIEIAAEGLVWEKS